MTWYRSDLSSDSSDQDDPWASVVDLMSAFALVLFLAVTFFIINYNRAEQKLKERQGQLLLSEKALKERNQRLSISLKSEEDLKKKNQEIQIALLEIQRKEAQLRAEREALLGDKQKLLGDKDKLTAEQQILKKEKDELSLQVRQNQDLVAQQKDLVARQQEETKRQDQLRQQCQEQLETIQKQRKDVLSAVHNSFTVAQQNTKLSSIGFDPKTGRFRLGGEVLFEEGRDVLTEEGKRQLSLVLDSLKAVVLKPKIRPLIGGIMIEGHTSQTGREDFNWKLSSRRSLAALSYLLSLTPKEPKDQYQSYAELFFTAAYGQFRPVRKENQEVDQRRSRRIEIRILFKSEEQIQGIIKTP